MKLLLVLLLAMGLAFAGTAFPDELPGTGLKILPDRTVGDLGGGKGYYTTDDNVTIAIVNAEAIQSSEWQEIKDDYESSGLGKKSAGGVDYYYVCEEEGSEILCYLDTYSGGIYYTVDVSSLGGTESGVVGTGAKVISSILAPPKPPSGNVKPPANGGGEAPPVNGGGGFCAPAAIMFLLLPAVFLARRN